MEAAGGEAAAVVCSPAAKNGIKSVAERDQELDSLPFCYPFGPDPVSPQTAVGFIGDGVGGASEIAGLDLCPRTPPPGHFRGSMSGHTCPPSVAMRVWTISCCHLGSVVPDWPKFFSYPRRMRHLTGPPPSWTPASLTKINGDSIS